MSDLTFDLPAEYILYKPLYITAVFYDDYVSINISANYQNAETRLYGSSVNMYTFALKGKYKRAIRFLKEITYPYILHIPRYGADKLHRKLDKAGISYIEVE